MVNPITNRNLDNNLKSQMGRRIWTEAGWDLMFLGDSLEYMEEHYGLSYNKDLFFVDYAPYASNIYPEVTIIRRQVEE